MNSLLEIYLDVDVLSNKTLALDFCAALIKIVLHVITLRRITLEYYTFSV
jgi:hypothetical protein